MRYDEKPVHRTLIVPWYDTKAVCLFVIVFMSVVFLFGIVGISVAGESESLQGKIWLPILLVVMSAVTIISTVIRLYRRFRYRLSKDVDF
jgi:hypothetical protein